MLAEKPVDENSGLTHNLYDLQNDDEKEKHNLATIHIETLGKIVQKINSLGSFFFFSKIIQNLSNALQSLFIFMERVIMVCLLSRKLR